MTPKLRPPGTPEPKPFMSEEEYRQWAAKFMEAVKPELDEQRRKRARSEEAARRHFIGG